ncbi:DUF3078 domain-containing protein [Phocaeicola sp.]|uniref:DUF3078 domain-containing protein n=1 Tax=Phocaeicola sp. TaxID=2773926 RepID=UPI003AB1E644
MMKKLGTLLLIIYSLGSGLYAQEAQRDLLQGGDSIVTEKAVLLDTLDAVRGNARAAGDSAVTLKDVIDIQADSLLLEIERAAVHFEDSVNHLKDSLMKAKIMRQAAESKPLPEVIAFKNLIKNYRTYFSEWEDRWDDLYLQITGIRSDANFYKLAMPATYYRAPIEQSMSIEGWKPVIPFVQDDYREKDIQNLPDLRRSAKVDNYINRQLLNFYVQYPSLVKQNEAVLEGVEPLSGNLVIQNRKKEKVRSMAHREKVDKVDEQDLLVIKPNFWKFTGDSYLQFSQNYISRNWYKGGESTKSMLAGFTWTANYDDRQGIQFENKIEWKLGFVTAPSDTLHSYKANNDMLRLTSKLGLRAFGTWYYTISGEFKTQFFSNYETNSDNLVSAFFSPAELNVGLGMDYKYTKDGVCNLSVLINPLNYTLYSVANDRIDPTKFNIKAGNKRKSVWGSRLEATLSWKIIKNLTWDSRFSYTTNYEKAVGEWENTFTFAFNRFLSTKLFVHGRFDDSVPRVEDLSYLQLQELLSFGLNYTW